MSHGLTGYYKRIIRRQIQSGRFTNEGEVVRHSLRLLEALERAGGPPGAGFASPRELQSLLLEGLASGEAAPMTAGRRRQIYAAIKAA
jgi:putative addiction module CopG family antidote